MVCKIALPGTKAMRELDLDVQAGRGPGVGGHTVARSLTFLFFAFPGLSAK